MFAWLTTTLLLLQALVFGLELAAGSGAAAIVERWGVVPVDVWAALQARPEADSAALVTLLTSTFLHAGWLHLTVNLIYLALFGAAVEPRLGHGRYGLLYLACGLAGSATYVLALPTSQIPAVGASGSVAGVIAAHLVLHPRATLGTLLPVFAPAGAGGTPVALLFALWLLLHLLVGAASLAAPGAVSAGWWPHLGGFTCGVALALLLRRHPVPVS